MGIRELIFGKKQIPVQTEEERRQEWMQRIQENQDSAEMYQRMYEQTHNFNYFRAAQAFRGITEECKEAYRKHLNMIDLLGEMDKEHRNLEARYNRMLIREANWR